MADKNTLCSLISGAYACAHLGGKLVSGDLQACTCCDKSLS